MEKAIGELDRLAGCAEAADVATPACLGLPVSRGVGIANAMQAIAILKKTPLYDGLREDGFDEVVKWIADNRGMPGTISVPVHLVQQPVATPKTINVDVQQPAAAPEPTSSAAYKAMRDEG